MCTLAAACIRALAAARLAQRVAGRERRAQAARQAEQRQGCVRGLGPAAGQALTHAAQEAGGPAWAGAMSSAPVTIVSDRI